MGNLTISLKRNNNNYNDIELVYLFPRVGVQIQEVGQGYNIIVNHLMVGLLVKKGSINLLVILKTDLTL